MVEQPREMGWKEDSDDKADRTFKVLARELEKEGCEEISSQKEKRKAKLYACDAGSLVKIRRNVKYPKVHIRKL